VGAKTTEADDDRAADGVLGVLEQVLEALENPVEWTFCGACGCLLSSADEGGCPSCRWWLTAALEEGDDESWE
jgi:hypothetical protein